MATATMANSAIRCNCCCRRKCFGQTQYRCSPRSSFSTTRWCDRSNVQGDQHQKAATSSHSADNDSLFRWPDGSAVQGQHYRSGSPVNALPAKTVPWVLGVALSGTNGPRTSSAVREPCHRYRTLRQQKRHQGVKAECRVRLVPANTASETS
jgi:hypothetical protein